MYHTDGSRINVHDSIPILQPDNLLTGTKVEEETYGGTSPINDDDEIYQFLETDISDMTEDDLPAFWDWRDINGIDFTPSVES